MSRQYGETGFSFLIHKHIKEEAAAAACDSDLRLYQAKITIIQFKGALRIFRGDIVVERFVYASTN